MEKQRPAVLGRPLYRGGNRPGFLDGAGTDDLGGRAASIQRQVLLLCHVHQPGSEDRYFRGNEIERRACHVLVSDKAEGPYRPMEDKTYLPAEKPTLDGTLWVDTDGKPYMVYCYEWLQTWDGTIEKIELKPDLSGSMGEGQLLFLRRPPWSREVIDGDTVASKVTDGPYLFLHADRTVGHDMDQLDLRCLYPRSSLFGKRHIGRPVGCRKNSPSPRPTSAMACCSVRSTASCSCPSTATSDINSHFHRVPHLFKVDDSGDKIVVEEEYR